MSQNLQEPINPNAKPRDDGGDGAIVGGDLFCTNCGTVNPAEARFCTNCGRSLETMGQMISMQFREGSSFLLYNAPVSLNAEARVPSPVTEETAPITQNPEAMSSILLVSSPHTDGTLPIIRNWFGRDNHGGRSRRIRSSRLITIALISLILLLVVSSLPFIVPYLHTILPASTATVMITPASKNFSNYYAISAVTGTPDASQRQVAARLLSYTTPSKSTTVKATGQGHQDATKAEGMVTLTVSQGSLPSIFLHVVTYSGVDVTIDAGPLGQGESASYSASADKAGSAGNIPAYDISGSYIVQGTSTILYAQNTAAFTGGQDAQDYTFVQQSDIDNVANPLQTQLTTDAQTAVQKQVLANEQIVNGIDNGIQCNPKITSNHRANDKATDVTVTVSVMCKGEVYDLQVAQSMVTDLLKSDAASQLGASYTLVGKVVTEVPIIVTIDEGGTISMNVHAQGVWVFQFSNVQKQKLAQLIVDKTQADTTALLLKQEGVRKVSIKTSGGWGNALPTSPDDIKMVVLSVSR
jgi:hypothetical protein